MAGNTKTLLNDMMDDRLVFSNASSVNLMIWYYLDDQQLAGADERWTVLFMPRMITVEKPHINAGSRGEECENVSG